MKTCLSVTSLAAFSLLWLSSAQNTTAAGLTPAPTSANDTAGSLKSQAQVETATAVGTITSTGNAKVTLTSANIDGGTPLEFLVAVASGDTSSVWAGKVRSALSTDLQVAELFVVGGTGSTVSLTRKAQLVGEGVSYYAANDSTLNLALENDTATGVTTATTSENTTAGFLSSSAQVETATAEGTISTGGDARVIVTADGLPSSPKTYAVPVLTSDTAITWAAKVRTALIADADLTSLYEIGGSGTSITLTRKKVAIVSGIDIYAANDPSLNIDIDNGTSAGILPQTLSVNTTAGSLQNVGQVETATALGAVTTSGDVEVIVTSAALVGSPKKILVPVTAGDSTSAWATKVRTALNSDLAVSSLFTASGTGSKIILSRNADRLSIFADNDPTLNLALFTGSRGIVPKLTSTNTTAGELDSQAQVEIATAAGAINANGTLQVVVTAAGLPGSPKSINVPVNAGDSATDWATKVRSAFAADPDITDLFVLGGGGTSIELTRKKVVTLDGVDIYPANDPTLNIALVIDTDGDSLADFDELYDCGTDPAKADTDDDGYRDDYELANASNGNSTISIPTYTLTQGAITGGNGTIAGSYNFTPNTTLSGNITYTGNATGAFNFSSSNNTTLGHGANATLTATPQAGYLFGSWTGDASGNTMSTSLSMTGNKTFGATFVNDLNDSDGDGLTNYDEVVNHGSDPNDKESVPSYTLTRGALSANGTVSGGNFTFTGNTTTSDSFTFNSTTNNASLKYGSNVTLTASPDLGYKVTWGGDASASGTLTINGNKTITANFTQDLEDTDNDGFTNFDELAVHSTNATNSDSFPSRTLTLTLNAGGNGTITGNYTLSGGNRTGSNSITGVITGNATLPLGSNFTLTASPNPGYKFGAWNGNATGTSIASHTSTLSADQAVGVSFEPDTADTDGDGLTNFEEVTYGTDPNNINDYKSYSLTLNSASKGTITGNYTFIGGNLTAAITGNLTGNDMLRANSSVNLTATPAPGYKLSAWTGNATGNSTTTALTMDGTKTVGASFVFDETGDYDLDGVPNDREVGGYSWNGTAFVSDSKGYKTNFELADSDGDGVNDGLEVKGYKSQEILPVTTPPTYEFVADTTPNAFKSNPLLIDSDGDLVSDANEAKLGTDPNDPSKYPSGSGAPVITAGVHAFPVLVGDEQSVAVDESFAPYGHRPDRDKLGDDGSSTVIDRNGVLIWSNKNGERVSIPDSAFAKTLHVSNTECLVYSNRFKGWNGTDHNAEIVIHRRGVTGGITTSKSLTIPGTVLDTASVTPTTYGYMLISGNRIDDGEESTQITSNFSAGDPPIQTEESKPFDKWDTLNLTLNIITWDGQLRTLAGRDLPIPKSAGKTFPNPLAMRYGSDGSLLINMITAETFLDRYDDSDPGVFASKTSSIWVSATINKESVRELPIVIDFLAYVDNDRLIGQRNKAGSTGVKEIVDYRQYSTGSITEASTFALPAGESVLPLAADSIRGLSPYIYTCDTAGTSLKLYRADATITSLGTAVTLPFEVSNASEFVRNPRDGSLLIKSLDGTLIWVPTTTNGTTPAVTGLGAPKIIPDSTQAKALFVSSKECVVWLNGDEPPLNGNLPPVKIVNYQLSGNNLISFNLTPPMEGNYAASTNVLSPDPDLEGWYITTFEKDKPESVLIRTYHLQLAAGVDRDNDGISDYDELTGRFNGGIATDAFDPDTDDDGLSDGDELLPFEFVSSQLNWEDARLAAIAKGAKLAVLDTPDKQERFKTAMLTAKASGKLWIGGHDTLKEGEFRWLTSSGLVDATGALVAAPTNWQQGQPGNLNDADAMEASSVADFKWAMAQVSKIQAYAIEYHASNPTSTDTDADGLADNEERTLKGDPNNTDTDSDGLTDSEEKTAGTSLILVDTDGDSLTDYAERVTHNSDPLLKDTDGDALEDYDEISKGTDPRDTDTDNDNLTDGDENTRGTDPKLKDTDGDTLDDDKEVLVHLTDPNHTDSDGDLLDDAEEVSKGTDPNNDQDPKVIDTDKDNLTNFDEIYVHNTDPNKADTDGDGINDDVEITGSGDPLDAESDTDGDGLKDKVETRTGIFVSATNTGTDPYDMDKDTDNDGLLDNVETGTGVYVSLSSTGTNPNVSDTDGDGLSDKIEIDFKSSPFVFDTDNDLASDADEYNATPQTNPRDPSEYPSAISNPEGLHAVVRSLGEQQVSIDETFAPFGHRPERDKVGDDGSTAIIDRNGVLIWSDKDGQTFTIPNSSLAKTLFVSNSECIVYNNRFKPDSYNTENEVAEIIIHRRGPNGIVSKTININGTLLDTAPVTATTYGFTILSGKRLDDGKESRQITLEQSNNNGVITTTEKVEDKDIWDILNLTLYQITWDGQLKELDWDSISIPGGDVGINFHGGTEIKASGSDGSIVVEMTTADEFVDRYDDSEPGVFLAKRTCHWVTLTANQESIEELPGVFTEALYVDNDRALLERLVAGSNTAYEIVDYRQRAVGSSQVASTFALSAGERTLPLGACSIRGLSPYIYTLNTAGNSLKLYRADAKITPLGAAITLPVAIDPSSLMIRNPRDASLLIKTEDSGLLWVPTTTNGTSSAVTGFGAPKFLPGTAQGKPLYVKADEAVAWLNSEALPINGVLPAAQVSHFQIGATGLVVGVNLSSWIEGKYVVVPQQLSPDPDLEGWYITTFEKTSATTSKMRKYRLELAANADRDDDGISDYLELTGFYNDGIPTDFHNPDTDGDGLSDGRELLPFEFVSDFKTWEEARLAAIAKGGRLAVLDDLQTPVLNPTMRSRILAAIGAKNVADARYWIGGHDTITEGQILWLDKVGDINGAGVNGVRQIVYDDYADAWDQFQPSNVNNSDGLQISKTSLKWSMAPIATKQGYVIQYPKTNPNDASSKNDSDGDGLPDIVETNTGTFVSQTDRGTNPAKKDTDDDTLPDNVETGTGIYVSSNNTGTDPNKKNSDGDGFLDNEENNSGIFVSATNPGTDPNATDTDGDGLSDSDEAKSVGGFFSNPLRLDTDGDLVSDFDEVNAGTPPGSAATDPNNPSSYPKSGITPLNDLHTIVRSLGEPQSVAIDQSFAPYGHRPDRDKIGDDGSSVMIDRNGVLIWIDKEGKAVTVPGSSLAKTLFVSNTECVVYKNRFAPDYNNTSEKAEIVIYRRNGSGAIISAPPTKIPGTIIDTCPITPTTYGFNLVSGSLSGGSGGTLNIQLSRLTWDGVLQPVAQKDIRIPTSIVVDSNGFLAFKNFPNDLKVNATGSDGSMVFSLSADLKLSGSFNPKEILFWVSAVLNKDAIINLSDKIPAAATSQVAYVDNGRAIVSRPKVGVQNVNQLLDLRYSDASGLTEASVTDLPEGDSILNVGAYSTQGLVPYVYTINAEGNSLSLWEASGAPQRLLNAVILPAKVQVSSAFVRNPRDGSLLIESDESGLIWIPTILTDGKPTGLGAPRILPNTMQGSPLFVSHQEAVAWLNTQDPPLNGSLSPAKIAHYQVVGTRLTATDLTPPIEGKYLALPSFLTPDPELEGWYLTSFEKDSPTSTILRRYRLDLASNADRDNDGLTDYAELRGDFSKKSPKESTDPWDPDTDDDGLSDGRELMPFEIVTTPLGWEAARLAAIAKGGKLAVLDSQDQQDRFKAALLAAKASGKFWVGGHDTGTEGQFRWLTSEGLATSSGSLIAAPTNWQPSQPNNLNDADGMEVSSDADFKWAMAPVSRTQAYVVEYPSTDPNNSDTDTDGYRDDYELANISNPDQPSSLPLFTLTWGTVTGNGTITGGNFTISANTTLSGNFTYTGPTTTGSITFSSNSTSLPHGANATITATPSVGHLLSSWTGDASGTTTPLVITMNGNKTVGATFVQDLNDTDGDGLTNYQELVIHGTNPNSSDSDGDKLSDYEELMVYGTNPNPGSPTSIDFDGDSLTDYDEVKTHKTNPILSDTDGDGLTDKQEIDGVNGFKSNPLVIDTDGDLVIDKDEANATPPTDPNDPSKYPTGSGISLLTSLHALPVPIGDPQQLSIDESFAPYGHRPDRDKLGDDGSGTIIDRNGVLIWTNKTGEALTIPNSSLAKTLHVSNTECLVHNNYFSNGNNQDDVAEIIIYRRGATGGITSSKTVDEINGTLLDRVAETATVTPTTYGYILVVGSRVDDGAESTQVTKERISNSDGSFVESEKTAKVDQWDQLYINPYLITWDGKIKLLGGGPIYVPKLPALDFGYTKVYGHGSDGSILVELDVGLATEDHYDPSKDSKPGEFEKAKVSFLINTGDDADINPIGLDVETLVYLDNDRAVYQAEDGRIIDYRRGGARIVSNLGSGEKVLPLSEKSIRGFNPYIYTINAAGNALKLYRLDATLTALGNAVKLPQAIQAGMAYVRNPRDGSVLIKSNDGSLIWIPTTSNGSSPAVTGLDTPRVIPNSALGKPLFVTAKECVVWLNSDAVPLNGSLPPASISHFQIGSAGQLMTLNLTPPMEGKNVVLPNELSPDPDLEGWYIRTFEKNTPASTLMRTYQLQEAGSTDRDRDGISDYDELRGRFSNALPKVSTDPLDPDTDDDGLFDGKELMPYEIISTPLGWEAARLAAVAKGGKLAVLDTLDKQDRFKAAMLAAKASGKFWVGGHDIISEGSRPGGKYQWLTSKGDINGVEIASDKNWQPSQPNNSEDADGMEVSSSADFKWAMAPVSRTQGYVIEYPATDPNNEDSDSDGYKDGYEMANGSNPNDPASFPTYTLTLTDGGTATGGSFTATGTLGHDTNASLTATAQPGYKLSTWTGDASGTTTSLTLTMDGNKTVGATFIPNKDDTDGDGVSDYDEIFVMFTDPNFNPLAPPTSPAPPVTIDYKKAKGTYQGMVLSGTNGLTYHLSLSVTAKGAFTGNIQGAFGRLAIKGSLSPTGTGDLTVNNLGELSMSMRPVGSTYVISGKLESTSAGDYHFELRRAKTSQKAELLTWTAELLSESSPPSESSIHTGAGVATGTVAKNAKVTFQIYNADGTRATYAGSALDSGTGLDRGIISLFARNKQGSLLMGNMILVPNGTTAKNKLFGNLRFLDNNGLNQDREVAGATFIRPTVGTLPLSSFAFETNNMVMRWKDGAFNGHHKVATWLPTSVPVPLTENESATVTYDRKTGLMKALYTLTDSSRELNKTPSTAYAVTVDGFDDMIGMYMDTSSKGFFSVAPNDEKLPQVGEYPPPGKSPKGTVTPTLSPPSKDIPKSGESYTVSVAGTGDWKVVIPPNANWLTVKVTNNNGTVSPALSGNGSAIVTITVAANSTTKVREATITIGGAPHKIRQAKY